MRKEGQREPCFKQAIGILGLLLCAAKLHPNSDTPKTTGLLILLKLSQSASSSLPWGNCEEKVSNHEEYI